MQNSVHRIVLIRLQMRQHWICTFLWNSYFFESISKVVISLGLILCKPLLCKLFARDVLFMQFSGITVQCHNGGLATEKAIIVNFSIFLDSTKSLVLFSEANKQSPLHDVFWYSACFPRTRFSVSLQENGTNSFEQYWKQYLLKKTWKTGYQKFLCFYHPKTLKARKKWLLIFFRAWIYCFYSKVTKWRFGF